MKPMERSAHWQAIYRAKPLDSFSWYQPVPKPSLALIAAMNLPKDAPILDVGGGDGLLVDHLLEAGYTDVTVLDISSKALERARERLGEKASRAEWIVADVTSFASKRVYALWHDRATFHFLTSPEDQEAYLKAMRLGTQEDARAIVATFSSRGPTTCSGTAIRQHDEASLLQTFAPDWKLQRTLLHQHTTPSGGGQEFVFGVFERSLSML